MQWYYLYWGRESFNHTGTYFPLTKGEREVGDIQLVAGHCGENKDELEIIWKCNRCGSQIF